MGLRHWPGKRAEQYTLARMDYTGRAADFHCRYGVAVPYAEEGNSRVDGIPFYVHDRKIYYRGLPILIMEPRDASRPPPEPGQCNIPEYVGCFADRLYIPGEGSYVVRTDDGALAEFVAKTKQISEALMPVIELVPQATIEAIVEATTASTPHTAHALSCCVTAFRSGAAPSDAAQHFEIKQVDGVPHELACVVGLFTYASLVSPEQQSGADLVLGITKLVHVDTGEPLELFTASPKWR